MPSSAVYELALLLTLKDAASGGLDRFEDRLRATGKEGRQLLQTVQDLRKDLRQGLTLAGVGVATLAALKKGVDIAADFESSMSDLRLSIEELDKSGSVNLQQLGNQLSRFDSLGTRLGNSLPGATSDFLDMFVVLKQGGLETETILNGAGEAAANLAVVMKEQPKALAEPFAQFGKQFQLKPEEYAKSADLFARIYRSSGLRAGELIEGSKYFQLRAGAPLGLKGLQGAETGARLMAALKGYGLEGGVGGREAATFFSHMATHKDALKEIKKDFGVDLQIFGKKGEFLGFDNAFKQLEKLRGLSTQAKMQAFKKLGGDEGAGVGQIFSQMGEAGWKEQHERLSKIPALQSQINEATQTYNAKMEALLGTLQNIAVVTFTPMLDTVKPFLDAGNSFATTVQEFLKANSAIASVATNLGGLVGVALTLSGTFAAMRAAWGLWKIASAASRSDNLLTYLTNVKTKTTEVETAVKKIPTTRTTEVGVTGASAAQGQLTGWRGKLQSIPSVVTTTLVLVGAELAISQLLSLMAEIDKREAERKGTEGKASNVFMDYTQNRGGYLFELSRGNRAPAKAVAAEIGAKLNVNDELERAVDNTKPSSIWKNIWYRPPGYNETTPWYRNQGLLNTYSDEGADKRFQATDRRLLYPEVMREFIISLRSGELFPKISEEGRKTIEGSLAKSPYYGEAYKKANESITEEFLKLRLGTSDTSKGFDLLNLALKPMPDDFIKFGGSLSTYADSAKAAAERLNSIKVNQSGQGVDGQDGGGGGQPTTNPPTKKISYITPVPRQIPSDALSSAHARRGESLTLTSSGGAGGRSIRVDKVEINFNGKVDDPQQVAQKIVAGFDEKLQALQARVDDDDRLERRLAGRKGIRKERA